MTERSRNKEEDKKNIKEWRRDKENKNKEDDRKKGGKSGGLPSNFQQFYRMQKVISNLDFLENQIKAYNLGV